MTLERLQELVVYKDGKFFWAKTRRRCRQGDEVGGESEGRWCCRLDGKLYYRNRLVWFWFHEEWPVEVDHEDHDSLNDKIENLKNGSHQSNMKNLGVRSNNKSGSLGVCWHPKAQKWMAYLRVNGKQKYLGLFDTVEEAAETRKKAQAEAGYHKNHGVVHANGH